MILTATIAAGEALSDAIDGTKGTLLRLHMPDAWTPAALSFVLSEDGNVYRDVVDAEGKDLMIGVTAPGAVILFPHRPGLEACWLKLRSGSAKSPIAQEAERRFVVAIAAPS